MLLAEIARASSDVAGVSARGAKVARLADTLADAGPEEAPLAVAYLSGELPQGSIGVGWAALREQPPPSRGERLTLREVDAAFSRVASTTGPGSQGRRRAVLGELFAAATEAEQRFLVALLLGELRQGAQEGVMVGAVARAAGVPAGEVRRGVMLAGNLGAVAEAALAAGRDGLARFRLTPLRPVLPMLAQSAEDLADALGQTSPAAVEWKLDGARLQVHRLDGEVRAFTRNLADVTERVPEVVAAASRLSVEAIVLDGEVISLDADGRPRPFQVTMSRFGSAPRDDLHMAVPLSVFFFDVLHVDGEDTLVLPTSERWERLASRVPGELLVPRVEGVTPAEAERFLDDAIARGHEGVMVKSLQAPYEAGRRGGAWLKVKRAHTLDLVVLAVEWGHGRRSGWLSNLHLGARDPATGGFVMLGKTFKGMTDAMLAWQTERLLELELRRDPHTVYVRPELVVEVAFDGVQASSRYPGGVALRFARVKGYRTDKSPADADTIEAVQSLAPSVPEIRGG